MLNFTLTLPSTFSKEFKRQARRYWATDGGVVGDLLCFDRPQTLVQVRDAYQSHFGVYTHCEHSFSQYLAHSLLRLAEHGLTRIEPAVPVALGNPMPLAFRLAAPRPSTSAARQAWQAYGCLVGRVLSAETPMTLDQIVDANRRVAAEEREGSRPVSPMVVAGWLLALAEAGVVEVLQAEVSP